MESFFWFCLRRFPLVFFFIIFVNSSAWQSLPLIQLKMWLSAKLWNFDCLDDLNNLLLYPKFCKHKERIIFHYRKETLKNLISAVSHIPLILKLHINSEADPADVNTSENLNSVWFAHPVHALISMIIWEFSLQPKYNNLILDFRF